MNFRETRNGSHNRNGHRKIFFYAIWRHECWNCHSQMTVAYNLEGWSFVLSEGHAEIWHNNMSKELLGFLNGQGAKIEFRTTLAVPEGYYANVCPNCDSIWGLAFA